MPLTISKTSKLLAECYRSRDCVVPHLIGFSGIGKTSAIEMFAKSIGARVFHYYLGQANPTEVTGITMPDESSHTMSVYDHSSLKAMKDGDILFLDEFLQASPQVMNASLTLIQERRLASGRMLPNVMICASSNPPSSPSSIPLNVRQRFLFLDVHYSRDEWLDYMYNEYSDGFPAPFIRSLADVIQVGSTSASWCMLTPRMVEKIFRLLINAEKFKACARMVALNDGMYSGNVSKIVSAAGQYLEYQRQKKIDECMDLIKSQVKIKAPDAEFPVNCNIKDMTRILKDMGLLEDPEFTKWLSSLEL